MTELVVKIDHPDAEKLLRAALDAYARMADHHAAYVLASKPRDGETTRGRSKRAAVLTGRAEACRAATIIPGGQAGATP